MKPREAINAIRVNMPTSGTYTVLTQALNMAIELFEKQIPKLPRPDDNGGCEYYEAWIECPVCSESIPEYTAENETSCYCIGCGQRLEWE
jgi:hypothetical protein